MERLKLDVRLPMVRKDCESFMKSQKSQTPKPWENRGSGRELIEDKTKALIKSLKAIHIVSNTPTGQKSEILSSRLNMLKIVDRNTLDLFKQRFQHEKKQPHNSAKEITFTTPLPSVPKHIKPQIHILPNLMKLKSRIKFSRILLDIKNNIY